MNKRILKTIAIGFLSIAFFASCEKEKETENISFETIYASFEIVGDNPYNLPVGTQYVEPGVTATSGDAVLEVESVGEVDHNQLGIYDIEYSAVNPDGYPASTNRTVIVYNPAAPSTDLSGAYSSNVVRTEADGTQPRTFSNLKVNITKKAQGIFYVSDLLGGYYDQGIKYGSPYAMTGYLALNPDNTFTYLSSHVDAWGDSLADCYGGSYNPETGVLTWKSVYAANDIFTVTLNK